MLTLNWNILWIVVNLLLLYVLLGKFLFRPVLGMMERRRKLIESSLTEAEEKTAQAGALKRQYETSLENARTESEQLLTRAKERARAETETLLETAREEADQLLRQADETARADRERLLRETQSQLAGVALAAAEKLLESSVDDEANRRLLDAFLAEEAGAAG